MSDPSAAGRVVSPSWLATHRAAVRVVDVRDPWEYESLGHVPGAVNVPFDRFRADEHAAVRDGNADADGSTGDDGSDGGGGEGMLPGAETVAALAGEAGVGNDDRVVAYDDHHGVFAARFLVTLELYGHPPERLHLLDGDFSAWQRGHEVSTDAPDVTPTDYEAGRPDESPIVDADGVAQAAADPDAVVVDTRDGAEFAAGHIPGAVRLDWRELVDDETRGLKSRSAMEEVLAARGLRPDRQVVLYCNTARRISHTYVVLRHLGYEDVAFYEGSLTEWEAEGRPVESGEVE